MELKIPFSSDDLSALLELVYIIKGTIIIKLDEKLILHINGNQKINF